ncbi:hypothetical protein Taro_007882, partial [Colocasia esculenta]|nr:hypothetical protein [Colocasia esculenta]
MTNLSFTSKHTTSSENGIWGPGSSSHPLPPKRVKNIEEIYDVSTLPQSIICICLVPQKSSGGLRKRASSRRHIHLCLLWMGATRTFLFCATWENLSTIITVPQWRDGEECGFFTLYYIYLFLKSAPATFSFTSYPYFVLF